MARTVEFYITAAQTAFEAGFQSEAARKRALTDLNRAYSMMHDKAHDGQISHANNNPALNNPGENRSAFFAANATPFELHQVRERHAAIIEQWAGADVARELRAAMELRSAIKAAEIVKHDRPANEVRVEKIRKSILDTMKARQASYIEGLDVSRLLGGLHVSVNAHLVYGHKGTVFPRYFFFLNGKFTALQTIMAIADTLEREAK